MRIHGGGSDSGRTAIDRRAVNAAGQLLMSAIWVERRVRNFSTDVRLLASPPPSSVSVASSDLFHSDAVPLASDD
jgi:hypothetical protein